MTNLRTYTVILLVVFIVMSVFGLYLPFMGMTGADAGCPFVAGGTSMCAQPLAHITHWQNMFLTILAEIFALAALAFSAFRIFDEQPENAGQERFRLRASIPIRPTLLQELFAQGILNRRAP